MIQSRPIIKFLNSLFFLIIALALCTSCESRKIVVNGLDEREANEILVFLATRGIEGQKVVAATEGGGGQKGVLWNISVESSQATEAMALLNQAGLPRKRSKSLIETLGSSGLVPSPLEQKARYQVGIAESIASTIRKIDGVLDADVNISFPEEDPLNPGASKGKITASVYIKHSGILDDPNSHLLTRIKRLVAGSVNGLDYDNVTIIADRARFNEALIGDFSKTTSQKNLVEVWKIVLAQESLQRFRILFFSLSLSILILLIFLIWVLWKFSLITKSIGGFKKLFSSHRVHPKELLMIPEEKKETEKKEEKKEGEEESEETPVETTEEER